MVNQVRPKCNTCKSSMQPVYQIGPRGKAFVKVGGLYRCRVDGKTARLRGGKRSSGFEQLGET